MSTIILIIAIVVVCGGVVTFFKMKKDKDQNKPTE